MTNPIIHWGLFTTETGLVIFSIAMMIFDMFVRDDEKRGKMLANTALVGLAGLTAYFVTRWNIFGVTFGQSFIQDGLSFFIKIIFFFSAIFTIYMGRQYQSRLRRGHGEFTLLVLFSLIGMMFLASANDFLLFFVSLEILSVSLYIMTAYLTDENRSIEAGFKYVVLGALSTALFLYGLSFVYGVTGSTSYFEIGIRLASMPSVPSAFIFGMVLILSSLAFKIAAVPFQLWAPDIYEGSPTPVTSFLATGSKAAGFVALIRLMMTVFPAVSSQMTLIICVMAALSIIYGNLGAIAQSNLKRLMGYSSIGHAGYLLIGLAAFSSSGKEAVLFYLFSYLFSTTGVFLVLVAVSRSTKCEEIGDLAGLSKRSPVLAAGMLLSLLSLAGVPPLSGFFAKFYLLWAGVKAGFLWLVIIGVINVITSLYYYLKIIKAMYLEKSDDVSLLKVTAGEKAVQYAVIAVIVLLGIYPGPLVEFAQAAFAPLLAR